MFVTFDEPEAVPGMLLAHVDRQWFTATASYRAWGLRRASFRQLWLDPSVYRQYAPLLVGGERIRGVMVQRVPVGDTVDAVRRVIALASALALLFLVPPLLALAAAARLGRIR